MAEPSGRSKIRTLFRCSAILQRDGHPPLHGLTMDISATGCGIYTTERVNDGCPITLVFDPKAIPDPRRDGAMPPLAGKVTSTRVIGETSSPLYRLGIAFDALPASLTARLGRLTHVLMGDNEANADDITLSSVEAGMEGAEMTVGPTLAKSRENLYSLACQRLEARHFAAAREAVVLTLFGDPPQPHYKALLHRINAEEALATGDYQTAAEEVSAGLELLPGDEGLLALRAQAARGTRPPARRS